MATLVIAVNVEVRFTSSVKLGPAVDHFVRIGYPAPVSMAAIISAMISIIARAVMMFVIIFGQPFDEGADHGACDNRADVVAMMIILAGI